MATAMKAPDNPKFIEPLYTLSDASLYLSLPLKTLWY